jgi:hypothetical protein
MALAQLTDGAKDDIRTLVAEGNKDVAREGLRIVKQLEDNPCQGERLREKSNLKPLAQAESRKVKFDLPNRRPTARPRYRYRLVHRIEPHEGSPEIIVVMAIGIKPRVYRDATTRVAHRLREQAQARRRQR